MVSSDMFSYVNVLGQAASANWSRMEVLNNNIANASTPNYKRKDVQFESYLLAEVAGGDSLDENIKNIDLSTINATTYIDQSNLSYRYDGNNVNIETENAELAKAQIRYQTLLDSMTNEYSRIRTALTKS
ncbi:flagellar basal-body rod protein FlgB [Anaeromicropila populeti]|uniref:Flagellar basal body rod protein FlgB n=2 Tax=Anaeromicropila populeti TaxID=37658 RepID=A0A1I6KXY9_9FIRM|nr:flagellar basal-body rod protein FlgB [Anaeromicropila populeti]